MSCADTAFLPKLISKAWKHVKQACTILNTITAKLDPARTLSSRPNDKIISQLGLTSQLCEFLTALGAGVHGVTSLDLALNLKLLDSGKAADHTQSQQAGIELASVLGSAFPALSRIGIGGKVNEALLRVLGAECRLLTSLHLLDGKMPAALLRTTIELNLLPHITHITMHLSQPQQQRWFHQNYDNQRELLGVVCACETITHMHVGIQHLQGPQDWLVLPPTLKELRCHELPIEPLPYSLNMPSLLRLEVAKSLDGFEALQLLHLLQAAPNLISLSVLSGATSVVPKHGCSLHLEPCSSDPAQGLQLLGQRLMAGLKLDGVKVSSMLDRRRGAFFDMIARQIGLRELMCSLNPLPGVTHCVLDNYGGESDLMEGRITSSHMQEVERLLPSVVVLECEGVWRDGDVNQLVASPSLQEIVLKGCHNISGGALVGLIVRMPWLRTLSHDVHCVPTTTEGLRAMLLEVHSSSNQYRSGVVGPDICKQVNRWHVSPYVSGSELETWKMCST